MGPQIYTQKMHFPLPAWNDTVIVRSKLDQSDFLSEPATVLLPDVRVEVGAAEAVTWRCDREYPRSTASRVQASSSSNCSGVRTTSDSP